MDRLRSLRVFVAVAEEQGFAAGARRLHMSPPAVTRAVAALEDRLGVKLLNRTTRYVRTTTAGQRYLEDARRILADIEMADDAAAGINAEPRGHLAVTAPMLFGRHFVTPILVEYLRSYPETQISALFVDRVVNLIEEGLDVGVRIGDLPDSSMRATSVGTVRLIVCAAPAYLRKFGVPRSPGDLVNHSIIASNAAGALHWKFGGRAVNVQPRLAVSTNDTAIEAAVRGFGITRLLSYQIAGNLASGELERILEDYEPAPSPIHVVHREPQHAPAKIRTFVDLITYRLRSLDALRSLAPPQTVQ